LVEHIHGKDGVIGSNPIEGCAEWTVRSQASSSNGRAPVSKTGCCRFESCLACSFPERWQRRFIEEHLVKRIIAFFQDSYAELKKVTWPSREEVGASTRVVLVSVVIFAVVLGVLDYLFLSGIDLLF
jgi:preprotein translocase subunit SecE